MSELHRAIFDQMVDERYGIQADYPWKDTDAMTAVYRHVVNRKWFALVIDLPRHRLGLAGDDRITVVNLKCDPLLIGSLRKEPGFYPAYHMNKERWITVQLDGMVAYDRIAHLLAMSYDLTKPKKQKSIYTNKKE